MRVLKRLGGAVALGAAILATAGAAQAQEMTFIAHLLTTNEPPPIVLTDGAGGTRPTPFGIGVFSLNAAHTALTMNVDVFNIDITGSQTPSFNTDNLMNAHIHVCPPSPGPTCPVRWGFFGAPDNDINPDNLVVTPFATGVGGHFFSVWDLPEGNPNGGPNNLSNQLPAIIAGLSYINFHTVQNPGGEIRGNLLATPEPSTYALLAGGLGVLGAFARRRRSA